MGRGVRVRVPELRVRLFCFFLGGGVRLVLKKVLPGIRAEQYRKSYSVLSPMGSSITDAVDAEYPAVMALWSPRLPLFLF